MKLVKEYINEKFVADSDPIHDMGIGLYTIRNFNSKDELCAWLVNYLSIILHTNEIPKDIINQTGKYIRECYNVKIREYALEYCKIDNRKIDGYSPDILKNILLKLGYNENYMKF